MALPTVRVSCSPATRTARSSASSSYRSSRIQVHAGHRRERKDDGLRSFGQRQLVSVPLGLPAGDRIFPIYPVQLGGRDEDTCDDTALLFS